MLEGVRVLDLTRMLAGPYASLLLADVGAEVVKIEEPGGDPIRQLGPPFAGGLSAYFVAVNRGKKSVVLDLRDPAGRAALERLIPLADVWLDNFRPGVLERLGFAPERIRALNPRMIVCSVTSFGEEGPLRDAPAFDLVIQAYGGAMAVTGEPGGMPVRLGIPLGDLAGGMFAAMSVCAALTQRQRTGQGCRISLSLLDCLISMHTYLAQYYFADKSVPGPQGSRHEAVVPYGAFATRDEPIVLAVFTEKFWVGFCRAIGRDDLAADPRFAANELRVRHRAQLEPILEEAFRARPAQEWLARLHREGVPAGPVLTLDRALSLPQVVDRGMVAEVGGVRALASPVVVDGRRAPPRPAPRLGEHTDEVLRGL